MFEKIKKRDNYDILAFFVCAICTTIFFSLSNRLIGGDYSICGGDFLGQVVPYIKLFLRKLFITGDLWDDGRFFYSFSNGLGDDVSANFAYFSVFSPFNIIYILIDDIFIASAILVIVKMAFASFGFYHFIAHVFNKRGMYIATVAVVYGLCGYNVVSYVNVHFMEGVFLLPILCIFLYDFIYKNKVTGLILTYAYSFIVCFYVGYLLGIFSAIIFLIYTIKRAVTEKGSNRESFFFAMNKCLKYFVAVVISFLISAFILLPAGCYIFNNMASDTSVYGGMKANLLDVIGSLFVGTYQENMEIYPYYYSGCITIILLPIYFTSNKINSKSSKIIASILLVFIVVCSVFAPFYLMMHCFDAPNGTGYRFGYLFSFIALTIVACQIERAELNKKKAIIIGICVLGIYCLVWGYKSLLFSAEVAGYSAIGFEINILFVLAFLALMVANTNKRRVLFERCICGLIIAETILNGWLTGINMNYSLFANNAIHGEYFSQQENAFNVLKNDNSQYRVYEKNSSTNIFQQFGVMGYSMFSTFENANLRKTMHYLGYMSTPRYFIDYGSTPVMRMLLGQKYAILLYAVLYDYELYEPTISENEYALPIGYVVSDDIRNIKYNNVESEINPFENQNKLISSMVGENISIFKMADADVEMSWDGIDVVSYDDRYHEMDMSIHDAVESGTFSINLINSDEENIYAYIPQEISAWSPSMPYVFSENGDNGCLQAISVISAPHILELGQNTDGKYNINITIHPNDTWNSISFHGCQFYMVDDKELEYAYDKLSQHKFVVNQFEDGYICGNVEVTENDKVLFFSIPYNEHWRAYVDGNEVAIVPSINKGFVSIDMPIGEHYVKIVYDNPMYLYGIVLTVVGIALLIIVSYYELNNKRKKNRDCENE